MRMMDGVGGGGGGDDDDDDDDDYEKETIRYSHYKAVLKIVTFLDFKIHSMTSTTEG